MASIAPCRLPLTRSSRLELPTMAACTPAECSSRSTATSRRQRCSQNQRPRHEEVDAARRARRCLLSSFDCTRCLPFMNSSLFPSMDACNQDDSLADINRDGAKARCAQNQRPRHEEVDVARRARRCLLSSFDCAASLLRNGRVQSRRSPRRSQIRRREGRAALKKLSAV